MYSISIPYTKFVPKIKIFITKPSFNIYIKSKTKVNIELNNYNKLITNHLIKSSFKN
jgi:hypothetical protein